MKKKFKELSSAEREEIAVLTSHGCSIRHIATVLGRSPSTVSREFRRKTTVMSNGRYYADSTNRNIQLKKQNARRKRKCDNVSIQDFVKCRVKNKITPELIAIELKNEYGIKIGKDTIYKFVYTDAELAKNLPRGHWAKHKKKETTGKKVIIPNRIDIDFRPQEANERKEIGHFEADCIESKRLGSKTALLVVVDRKSRLTRIKKLTQKTTEQASSALKATLSPYKNLAKTITYDNGTEFCWHEKVNEELDTKSYFCKPYHSWEKGTVENINGIIRWWYPKKTDFKDITEKELQKVENWINNRRMKVLNYKTPNQVFEQLSRAA